MTRPELEAALDAREQEYQRGRCPRAARLLDKLTHALTHEVPAFPERGSRAWDRKILLENFVIAIESDMNRGVDSTEDDEQYVGEKIRQARS